jgi:hypothetical protein
MGFWTVIVGAAAGLSDAFSGLVGVSEEQAAIITLLVTANATRLRYRRFDIQGSRRLGLVKRAY